MEINGFGAQILLSDDQNLNRSLRVYNSCSADHVMQRLQYILGRDGIKPETLAEQTGIEVEIIIKLFEGEKTTRHHKNVHKLAQILYVLSE